MSDLDDGNDASSKAAAEKFGDCCEELREAIDGDGFEPLITLGSDNILYSAVGLVELEEDEPGMLDHPIFFCPFCGTKLQDRELVSAQIASESAVHQ